MLADDLDVPTTAMLPRLPDLVENKGISFTRAYATQPLCAPSRASILTGQYTHNHGVIGNEPPSDGFVAFRRHEGATIATWLKSAGYRTALVGKYMNAYAWGAGEGYIPPGWDEWYGHLAALEDDRYWDYWVNDNRDVYRHGHNAEDYSVDVETRRAVQFIRDSASRPEPIFLYAAPQAPHAPAFYAERFGAEFRYSFAPRPPSFNESDVRDEAVLDPADRVHDATRRSTTSTASSAAACAACARSRRRSSGSSRLSPRRGASRTPTSSSSPTTVSCSASTARSAGRTTSTRRRSASRSWCAGPGSLPRKVDEIVLNIDLAPTLLELAGAPIPETVDGASLVPFLRGTTPPKWRTDFVAEAYGLGPTLAVRTRDALYTHNETEEFELYDMTKDPSQVNNLYRLAEPGAIATWEKRIQTLATCRGASCRALP